MLISIPVLVSEQKQPNQPSPTVFVRPLFGLKPIEQGGSMQRALNKLGQSLRENLEALGKEARHDEIARLTFSPVLTSNLLTLRLTFSSQNFDCKYLMVSFDAFGRKIVYSPNVANVWFEMQSGEDLRQRAEEVLTEYFKKLERRDGKGSQNPELFSFTGKSFVTTFDLNISLPQKFEKQEFNLFAMLGSAQELDGARELRSVGRCLESLYPDDLERAVGREKELTELRNLLQRSDRRPVVIVGKRQVGKTSLLHEYIFSIAGKRQNHRSGENLTWLISPQRLISGMSFVGQWENRLTAILKEAKKQSHLLYFDDLVGLFFAGISANADLNVAQVLKPYIERRDVRVVAEITPETWRVVQEKDRSFAELFQVLRIEETTEDKTLKILLSIRRELEHKFNCEFSLDGLPTALDLQRRYVRDAAFPGKVANFLKQISTKFRDAKITRENILQEFESKSGMNVAFLDDTAKLERKEIIRKISEGVIGQKNAIEAAADVISIAKARLNDASRPLASFLFLGTTGVGKTEAAKQIAAYLYGNGDKLLRFDMNEFISSFDVARLVGTFDQPEGLLTSAIRRQPFSVVLLDEIEKAHPDVFNLLLQVMGDGRLTDAFGRTADFSNAIIILTSNLGSREANLKLGFRETNETSAGIYRQTAEKFFKPEFFNRIDRVIPFERLSREDVEQIARIQLQKVFSREGFARRNCRLELEPSAMQKIIDEGYHPELGARALKRAIEKNLTAPVAASLAALKATVPTMIKISRIDHKFVTQVGEIKPFTDTVSVWLTHDFSNTNAELDKIDDALDRIEQETAHLKPTKEIIADDAQQARYFLVQEHFKRVERMIERADKWNEGKVQNLKTKIQKRQLVSLREAEVDFSELLGASNVSFRLRDLAFENRIFGEKREDYLQDIWRETSLLQLVTANREKPSTAKCVMTFRSADVYFGKTFVPEFCENYKKLFSQELGLKASDLSAEKVDSDYYEHFLAIEGSFALDLASAEIGSHIFVSKSGGFTPIEVHVFELETQESFEDFAKRFLQTIDKTRNNGFSVIRLYSERGLALDFRSGLITKENLTVRELRTFVLSGLEPPKELV